MTNTGGTAANVCTVPGNVRVLLLRSMIHSVTRPPRHQPAGADAWAAPAHPAVAGLL